MHIHCPVHIPIPILIILPRREPALWFPVSGFVQPPAAVGGPRNRGKHKRGTDQASANGEKGKNGVLSRTELSPQWYLRGSAAK